METIIEKTYIKLNLGPVKELIKAQVEKQKLYKNARKNATFSWKDGKCIWDPMSPSEAQSSAHWQSMNLRILYAAYTLLRGKKLSQMENYDENDSNHFLNKNKAMIGKTLLSFQQMSEIKK